MAIGVLRLSCSSSLDAHTLHRVCPVRRQCSLVFGDGVFGVTLHTLRTESLTIRKTELDILPQLFSL